MISIGREERTLDRFLLDGRVAVVTGAARGLGRAIALALAMAGADVGVNDCVPVDEVAETVDAIRHLGRKAIPLQADIADEEQVGNLFRSAETMLGPIHILVNNAGILLKRPLVETTVDEWDRVMAINLRGTFLCCRAVLPGMLDRGAGKIVNVASQLAYKGDVGSTCYSASKGGVLALTRALAREVGPRGVNVNAVAPGPINTDALAVLSTPDFIQRKLAGVVEQRFAEVEDVAPSVVFLASDAARFFHGQALSPNGGGVMP
ncbi:MAG: 3-oxoacyl-ACP reductase FabG [Chloroflexi bacterium]|nr:3-oxoacyl-ACP reductase FabG [Chloroflexota bacterium]